MSSSPPEPSLLFARDIAAFSDAELDQYLEANGRFVQVEDPDNLPDYFIQRLRARAGASDRILPHTIDLNYVSTRLEDVPADRERSPRSPSLASTELFDEEEDYRCRLEEETASYNELINDGGRPSHPLVNLNGEGRVWDVFGSQLREWRRFRKCQRLMRTEGPIRYKGQKIKQGRFLIYCRAVTECLTKHGFVRPFRLDEDLDRQDKLTTWIEFLEYEYCKYDKHTKKIKRLQPYRDEAWNKLVESKVLRPSENEDCLWGFEIGFKLENEMLEAQKAVESTTSAVNAAEMGLLQAQSEGKSKGDLIDREQEISIARLKLAVATESLERTRSRCDFIGGFQDKTRTYRIAMDDAARQSKLLPWILQQVPLIELEISLAKVAEHENTRENGGRQQSLKRNRTDDRDEEPASKRRRQGG